MASMTCRAPSRRRRRRRVRSQGWRLHGAWPDRDRLGPSLRLIDIRLHLGVGQRVRLTRLAGGGGEDDAHDAAVEVHQWSARIPRLDLRLRYPDVPDHQVLSIDVAALRSHLAVADGRLNLLPAPTSVADPRSARTSTRGRL